MNRYKLKDLGSFKNGANYPKDSYGSGIPIVNVKDLFTDRFVNISGLVELKTGVLKNPSEYSVQENDILFSRSSLVQSGAGMCALAHNIPSGTIFCGFIIRFRIEKLDLVNPLYLLYLLRTPAYRKIFTGTQQTNITNINQDSLGNIEVLLPCLEKQNEIVKILNTVDNKKDNNNQINFELESMAKTLYDYWFLQFEFPNAEGKPYKSSGGKMVYNEQLKKEIPEGWEVKKLGELLIKQNRNFNYDKVVNTVDLSIMPTNSLSLNELNKSNLFDTNLFGLKKYDILFGSIRPYLKKACIAPCDGAVAGTVHCYTVNKESDYNFSLITLCSDNLFKFAVNNSKGTKMPVVSSDDLLEYLVVYNEDTVELFNSLNLKEIISNNVIQNQELASLRDFLLPLLMNGQVTIKDEKEELENQVQQAVVLTYMERFTKWKQAQGYAARGDVDDETLKKIFDAMDEDDKK